MTAREEEDPKKLPLREATLAFVRSLRGIENYKLMYANDRLPVLSFLYAIYAGGEHTIYCDHSSEYAQRYLTGPGGREALAILARLDRQRFDRPPPRPTSEELDALLSIVKEELAQMPGPEPIW